MLILKYNTNISSGTTVTLPLHGSVNMNIDWDDGATSATTSSGFLSHTYSSDGEYSVSGTGSVTQFGHNFTTTPNVEKLTDVIEWVGLGVTSISYAFKVWSGRY